MILLGRIQELQIDRKTSVGFYLVDAQNTEDVLFPNQYISPRMEEGDVLEVFVYKDNENRMVATTEFPYITVGKFAYLKVNQVNKFGAFLDWGMKYKELLVPFKNQANRMEEGKAYIVYLYEDEDTRRLVATSKINNFLETIVKDELKVGQEVELLARGYTEIGLNVIINHDFQGIIYKDEIFERIDTGDQIKGYVKRIREDGKVDISLQAIGYNNVPPNAALILEELKKNKGFLPFNDKSDPDDIRDMFGISKKIFKKSIGALYKQKIIEIKKEGIHLL